MFYIGHLEAFDWNLLTRSGLSQQPGDPALDALFAFGIDPVDGNLPCDAACDWPALDAVRAYCAKTRAAVDRSFEALLRRGAGVYDLAVRDVMQMLLEHRLMHLETLAYMLPHLPLDSFEPTALPDASQPDTEIADFGRSGLPGQVRRIEIPAGAARLGRERGGEFGWDNEYTTQTVWVDRFLIDARNVTNGEFLDFVRAGGYGNPGLWLDADYRWIHATGRTHPLLWLPDVDGFRLRTAFAERPLPLDWPAMVSLAEARAYARFAGRRLLTEPEFHRAAYGTKESPTAERSHPWGEAAPLPLIHGNFGCVRYDPSPVAAFPAGDSSFGVTDLVGNGWEWTDTPFAPLEGFSQNPLYPGYSQPFFDGKHFVMKGASMRTDSLFLRRSFRNCFQAHYPYVFATFRCASSA